MKISIVIPTIPERKHMLDVLVASLPHKHDIIIMDDPKMSLSEKRNKGALKARNSYILFIDDDNVVEVGAIKHALDVMEYDKVGVVGLVACYHDDSVKVCDSGSYRNFLTGFTYDRFVNRSIFAVRFDERKGAYEVDEVANAFMIKREVFEKIGLFDNKNFPMDLDEADFCFRAKKAGYQVVMSPKSRVYHRSITYSRWPDFRRKENAYQMARGRIIFHRKHNLYLWFVPAFAIIYLGVICLRGKFNMIPHFIQGLKDGLFDPVKD
tara:strand:- start:267 stop:1064 length:798 start_codon:yes stop_codon:yes gene_type:complete